MIPAKYWSPTKKLMLLGAMAGGKAVEATATGNPLTFLIDLAKPLKSLLIPFAPQQTGSGDPSPSNIRPIAPWIGLTVFGGGKNLFDEANAIGYDRYINYPSQYGSTWKQSADSKSYTMKAKGNTRYTVKANNPNITIFRVGVLLVDPASVTENQVPLADAYNTNESKEFSFVTPNAECWLVIQYNKIIADGRTGEIQVEVGQTATTYEPYKPITETSIVFPPLTNNLFSAEIEQGEYNYTYGYKQDSTTRIRSDYVLLKAGKYTISCTGMNDVVMYVFDTNKRFLVGESQRIWKKTTFTFTISDDRFVAFVWRKTGDVEITPSDISNVMLNTGETAKPYEPYTNSVYGGTLEVVTGVLTVTHVCIEVSKQDFTISSGSGAIPYKQTGEAYHIQHKPKSKVNWAVARQTQKMDCAVIANPYSETTFGNYVGVCFYDTILPTAVRISQDVYDSLQDGDSVSVCYEIEDTFEVQLTPQQITALVGNNTIWSDADGSMTAVYLKKE